MQHSKGVGGCNNPSWNDTAVSPLSRYNYWHSWLWTILVESGLHCPCALRERVFWSSSEHWPQRLDINLDSRFPTTMRAMTTCHTSLCLHQGWIPRTPSTCFVGRHRWLVRRLQGNAHILPVLDPHTEATRASIVRFFQPAWPDELHHICHLPILIDVGHETIIFNFTQAANCLDIALETMRPSSCDQCDSEIV